MPIFNCFFKWFYFPRSRDSHTGKDCTYFDSSRHNLGRTPLSSRNHPSYIKRTCKMRWMKHQKRRYTNDDNYSYLENHLSTLIGSCCKRSNEKFSSAFLSLERSWTCRTPPQPFPLWSRF